ncbi:MAG TPA: kelch repeat-containing protein, partial [Polyangiaceae bacterium]
MSSQRTAAVSAIHTCIGVLGGLLLSGCPLTDKYYIDPNAGDAARAGNSAGSAASHAGGSVAVAGASQNELGGAPNSDGDPQSGGTDSSGIGMGGDDGAGGENTAGSGGLISEGCIRESCSGDCCLDICVDTQFDPANCGACGHACPTGRTCSDGTCHGWTAMAPPPREIVAREKAAYTAIGGKLFIFGGLDAAGKALRDGAIYDLTTDSWTLLPESDDMPSARQMATAGWTGRRVFIVGGRDASGATALLDGARFDLTEAAWVPLAALGTGRIAPWAAPGPDYILLWGGLSAAGAGLTGGERYAYNST